MRALASLLCTAVAASLSVVSAQSPDDLPRRIALGATLRPPSAGAPARLVRVDEGSALARAGMRAGDEVPAIDGHPITDAVEFDRRLPRCAPDARCASASPGPAPRATSR